jgi:hypothetical protein
MVVVLDIPGSIPLPQLGGCAPQDGANPGLTSGRRRRVRERGLPQWADRLNVDGHQLTGTIPTTIGNLTDLTWLVLAGNQLVGPFRQHSADEEWGQR